MKIVLIQHRAFLDGSGGTEKICTFLANQFAAAGHSVTIATYDANTNGKPFFPLNENIQVDNIYSTSIIQKVAQPIYNYKGNNPLFWIKHKLKKKYAKAYNYFLYKKVNGPDGLYTYNLLQRAQAWNRYLQQLHPDVIITMSIETLLEITYQQHYDAVIINSTNGRPDYDYTDLLWYRSRQEMQLLKEAYKHLSAIQVLFDSYKQFIPDSFTGKSYVIPNPAPQIPDEHIVHHTKTKERYKIIQIGSLVTDCKQQHLSIEVFSKIAHKYPHWDLYFWGQGPDYTSLKEKIAALEMEDRIHLMGLTDDPLYELSNSDIFLFPSKYEGLPLALLEAMSAGLPSLGFASCSGVNELIQHGENGFLANDIIEMQQYLELLINDAQLRERMGFNAHNKMKSFSADIISNKWKTLLDEVTGR